MTSGQALQASYVHHLLGLAARAEAHGVPFGDDVQAPAAAVAVGKRAVEEIQRALGASTPWARARALKRLGEKYRGGRGGIPSLAAALAAALPAFAEEQTQPRPGNPHKARGGQAATERQYAERALAHLLQLALLRGRFDWALELFEAGAPPAPSRGRALVSKVAQRMAQEDGRGRLDPTKLAKQVREATPEKPPYPSVYNFLGATALLEIPLPGRVRRTPLVKPAGMRARR